MEYPKELQYYRDSDHDDYMDNISLVDFVAYTWAYISYFMSRLSLSPLSAAEDDDLGKKWQWRINTHYEFARSNTSHPRNIAIDFVREAVKHRQRTLPYFVEPDLSLLEDDAKQPSLAETPARKAFWLGWGV